MSMSSGHSCSCFLWISSFNLVNKAIVFHIYNNIVCQCEGDLLLCQHFTSICAQVTGFICCLHRFRCSISILLICLTANC